MWSKFHRESAIRVFDKEDKKDEMQYRAAREISAKT
jgi:hypothetical protein